MKIKTEIITKEQLEVDITVEELAIEIGKILSDYGYYVSDSEPSLEVEDDGDYVRVELYKDEVDWEGLMKGVFAKDLLKALQNYKQKGNKNETTN